MTINEAVTAIEALLADHEGVVEARVHPSGDDTDVIKIWVDLGTLSIDRRKWIAGCEARIREELPGAAAFRLQIRAEFD